MRTFAERSKAAQQTKSAKSMPPTRALSGQSRDLRTILNSQRTIGSHAAQRLPQDEAKEHSADRAATVSARFAYDFSQVPLHTGARTNSLPYFERIQALFGKHDLSRVHAEVGGAAAETASEMDALAFTSGTRVVFRNTPDLRLAAHEAAHVIQQRNRAFPQGGMGRPKDSLERHADAVAESVVKNRRVESLLDTVPATGHRGPLTEPPIQLQRSRDIYPWVGEITGTWSASLRETPHKSPSQPYRNTAADLPRGTQVTVTGRRGGWLNVSVKINGLEITGYVSQELVRYVRASAFEFDPIEIEGKIPSVSESMVILKRAETEKAKAGLVYKPGEEQENKINLAVSVLERTGKYTVNPVTYRVGFVEAPGKQVKVTTIEDFILFVEQVERQYPSATAGEIASEIRQIWFSDLNWEILVSSEGIKEGGKHLDIEEQGNNPIASRFDVQSLKKAGMKLETPLGAVDFGHVMTGIDAALSAFPSTYPKSYLASRGHDDSMSELKHKTLRAASGGDSRDFTTWAGDLGQAYAEYLVERYVEEESATLAAFMSKKSPPAELLGDIHGYIAVQVWKDVPEAVSPSAGAFKVSNVLRDLYLVGDKSQKTYRQYVEKLSGKSGSELKPFIVKRAKSFARPWFAKNAKDATPGFGRKTWFGAWSREAALDEWMEEFDQLDAEHERSAKEEEKLGKAVDDFITTLGGKLNR